MAGFPSTAKGNKVGAKAKQPRPGLPLDKEKIRELIKHYNGNLSRVADVMGSTRGTIRKYCDNDPELKQALADARERFIDRLEDCVWTRAEESNDTTLQIFLLKTQGRHRGYDQDSGKEMAADVAKAAFDFILNKSKNPAEST